MITVQLGAVTLSIALFAACNSNQEGNSTPARNWEGEVRILPGDTAFVPCATTLRYTLTGPGLDSIAHRYAFLSTTKGQWIKTWCTGGVPAGLSASKDSVLNCTAYMHMDPAVHCPPLPVDSMSGTYRVKAPIAGGVHTETLLFLPGGDATIVSTAPGLHAEVDGRWGLNPAGNVIFEERQQRYSFEYIWKQGQLVRPMPGRNTLVKYDYVGPAERLSGAFGRTARWLAAIAKANGLPLQPEDLRPAMRLDSLFPSATAHAALQASARDSLALGNNQAAAAWEAATTVEEVTLLVRNRMPPR